MSQSNDLKKIYSTVLQQYAAIKPIAEPFVDKYIKEFKEKANPSASSSVETVVPATSPKFPINDYQNIFGFHPGDKVVFIGEYEVVQGTVLPYEEQDGILVAVKTKDSESDGFPPKLTILADHLLKHFEQRA